jgi:hypothetical protein
MRASVSAAILLAMLAAANAACPNQCSGHGRCTANDKCDCYRQSGSPWGQRSGWTGADCSLRTCAVDTAFDTISNVDDTVGPVTVTPITGGGGLGTNDLEVTLAGEFLAPFHATPLGTANQQRTLSLDNTIILRVARFDTATTPDSGTFQWKWASDSRPQGSEYSHEIAFVIGATTVAGDETVDIMLRDPPQYKVLTSNVAFPTGIRVRFINTPVPGDIYTFQILRLAGTHYLESNDNSFHQQLECSNRGLCDRVTGQCKCSVGYDGEACQRTTCKNSCSGHGICQDEQHFATDGGNTYALATGTTIEDAYLGPYDARKQMGCKCDDGFRGFDCSLQECPSGTDPLLADYILGFSGSGYIHDLDVQQDTMARDCSGRGVCDYSSGNCKCFKGYFGERCETQTNFV